MPADIRARTKHGNDEEAAGGAGGDAPKLHGKPRGVLARVAASLLPARLREASPAINRHLRIFSRFFKGEEKGRAWFLVVANVALLLLCTWLYVVLSYVQRDFSTAMQGKDSDAFYWAIWRFVGIVCVAAPLFTWQDYMQDLLTLEWRNYMTKYFIGRYFSNRCFYDLKLAGAEGATDLDNPDERICDDVQSYVAGVVGIIAVVLSKFLNSVAFTGVLWGIAPHLVGFLALYAFAGSYITTTFFGRRLMKIHQQYLQKGADLRFSLVRVRENAESVAFYRGEGREKAAVEGRLAKLIDIITQRIVWSRHLGLFTSCYHYATIIIPSLLMAPKWFRGEIEFGVISQTGFAFSTVLGALSLLVNQIESISGLAAESQRIDALLGAMDSPPVASTPRVARVEVDAESSLEGGEAAGDSNKVLLRLEGLELRTPQGARSLFKGLSLHLGAGESLLVMGASGTGKSSLLRCIAGLWGAGSGAVHAPPAHRCMFLPQKPYMPLGSLREQLLFPSFAGGGEGGAPPSDGEMESTLGAVGLGGLCARVGGLGATMEWSDVLSVGEQQRVAFARLLLQRPVCAFLDEATSALDPENEARAYSLLSSSGCRCWVSIGHRDSLRQWHGKVLQHVGEAEWRVV